MNWVQRGQRRYLYRSRRVGGRVLKEYIGTGPAAELAADVDVLDQERRRQHAAAERARQDQYRQLQATLMQFLNESESLIRAALVTSGFYQHHRGRWRRRNAARMLEAKHEAERSAAAQVGRA